MKKLKETKWFELVIAYPAFIPLSFAFGNTFGFFFTVALVALTLFLAITSPTTNRGLKVSQRLSDLQIAREKLWKAHQKGKVNRLVFLKCEMWLMREINLLNMAVASVPRGSRIDLEKVESYQAEHAYF